MPRRHENPPMVDDYSHVPVRHPSTSQLQTMRRLSYRVLGHADTAVEMVAEAMEQAAVTDRVNRALMEIESDWKLLRGPVDTRRERFAELMGTEIKKTSKTRNVSADASWPEWAAARLGFEAETQTCSHCGGSGRTGVKVSQQAVMRKLMDVGDNTNVVKSTFLSRMSDPSLSQLQAIAGLLDTDLEGAAAFCGELAERVEAG